MGFAFLGCTKVFFWDTKDESDFFGYKSLFFLDTKCFFRDAKNCSTFSEVKGVSPIVSLFLTFWKVKSGKGVFFNGWRPNSSRKQ